MIQRIYDDHFEGADEAEKMRDTLSALSLPEPDRSEVLARADQQVRNAREWRDVINTFFHRLSGAADGKGRRIYD
jgi:alpha-glucuronidase